MAFGMTASPQIPQLQPGDRLSRDEFERRYQAMSESTKAELIEGVVYMSSAVGYIQHGRPEHMLLLGLSFYELLTPGVSVVGTTTLRLDGDNVPQPDILMRLPERAGGRSRVASDGYLEGAPELVLEIAASSVSCDLHQKLAVYRRNGVREYLVHRVDDGAIDWFVLEGSEYVALRPDPDGVLKSRQFPGLWLAPDRLLAEDLLGLRAVVERGCASEAHRVFLAGLQP